MNKKQLYREIGLIDDDLIEEAAYSKPSKERKHSFTKWTVIAAIFCILISSTITTLAVTYIQKGNLYFYIRRLSPENINLLTDTNTEADYDAEKFFEALKSDNVYYQYIAINRLVECFNDIKLREKAIKRIEPFIQSSEKKLAEAAAFAVDILSQSYESNRIYKLSDGSMVFTLFHNYSDYGSYNEIWRIKEGKLKKYLTFSDPSKYIKEIVPSPDGSLIAVTTCSNKSEFIIVIDPINGFISPDLIGSARTIFGAQKGYDVLLRIDNENYSSLSNISWKSNQIISFDARLSYDSTKIIENVSVNYDFGRKAFNIEPRD